MSILIRGMEMPKNCQECGLYIEGACYAKGYRDYRSIMDTAKPDDCPLVELPPRGRLIDATFEENHYASMLLDPTPDVTEQDKHKAKIIIEALRMAGTVIEAEGSET